MSFETYLSINIGSFVAIMIGLISIHTENIERKQRGRKKNRKEPKGSFQNFIQILKKHKKAVISFALVEMSVFIVTTYIYEEQRLITYNEIMEKASFEFSNHNYLEAAKYYIEASNVAYNRETRVMALSHEGTCYLELGLYSDDDKYYSLALSKYYSIISNKKYKNTEYYPDALINSCFALRELNNKMNDENIKNIVYQLENDYDFSNIESIPLEKVDLMNSVALALAQYYKYATNENFKQENGAKRAMTKQLSDKAIFYYGIVCQLMPLADTIHFKNTDLLHLYLEISDLMIKGSISSENWNDALTNYTNTINFCKDAIETFEQAENDSNALDIFLRLKINLGKTYYLLSMIDGEEHLSPAYEELKPLLYIDINRDLERTLLDAGYYLILTTKCTEEEIDIILDRYEHQLEGLTIDDEDYLTLLQSTLNACKYIIDNYEINDRAVAKSEELSIKAENLMRIYKK